MQQHRNKGRGAQVNLPNPFNKHYIDHDLSDDQNAAPPTQFFMETPKSIVSKSDSPDLGVMHSINPYQGCEHGCSYCYARNSHHYWGFSSGVDFESKIIVKPTAPEMLKTYLSAYQGKVTPIVLSGNTDCYQPAERKFELTRKLLHVFYQFRYPVSLITKNSLILRDLDILSKLSQKHLVHVYVSVTTLNESTRRKMEPRTATPIKRLQVIEKLSSNGIPVGIMNAPIIPGLTDHETPEILKQTAANGSLSAGFTVVRLNGSIGRLFEDWLLKTFPEKASKILNQIADCHQGNLNDSRWYQRQKGTGHIAGMIQQMFHTAYTRYYNGRNMPSHDKTLFRRGGNLQLDF